MRVAPNFAADARLSFTIPENMSIVFSPPLQHIGISDTQHFSECDHVHTMHTTVFIIIGPDFNAHH